jgi:transposase-like protein
MSALLEPELTQEQSERGAYTDYSIERKAEILALVEANGGNLKRTADQTGIQYSTLQYWQANKQRFNELRQQKELDLASKFESNAHLLVNSISEHDLSTASLSQKATAAGIMVDKMQLLRSQPTQITANVNIDSLTVTLQQVIAEITSTDSTD